MRSNPTDAEHRLWQILRAKRLDGWKFRRQPRMGPCTPDFACHEAKLVVEADGGQHGCQRDARRDAWFRTQGYRVLRFWNNDIFNNEEGVVTVILTALEASVAASSRDGCSPSPQPLPHKGGGAKGGAPHA